MMRIEVRSRENANRIFGYLTVDEDWVQEGRTIAFAIPSMLPRVDDSIPRSRLKVDRIDIPIREFNPGGGEPCYLALCTGETTINKLRLISGWEEWKQAVDGCSMPKIKRAQN